MKSNFKDDESGALLVFFALCAAAIFLVAALSFDIGKRASTQTELQSYADNVALAAAGELDGFDNAIIRAKTAAANLIADDYVFGTMAGNTNVTADTGNGNGTTNGTNILKGPSTYQIFFYETLPPADTSPITGALDQNDRANDSIARFVRILVNDVEVEWSFARLLTIFDSTAGTTLDNLEDVNAEAVAGYTSLACDVAPIFFCKPITTPEWKPQDHVGDQILVRTGQGGNSFWESGNFGWLDVRETIPDESLVLDGGPCDGLTGNNLLICLIAAEDGVTTCFENGLLTTLPGQKQGIESAVFNTRFDMYNAVTSQYKDSPTFQPAPIITRGFEDNGGDICLGNATTDISTMPFPRDDCYYSVAGCEDWSGVGRFGDGNWSGGTTSSDGRLQYVEANYSQANLADSGTPGTINLTEYHATDNPNGEIYIVDAGTVDEEWYHIDDPFRPGNPGSFPVIANGSMRFDYYRAEVAATYYSNPQMAFDAYENDPTKAVTTGLRPNPQSLFPSGRPEDGLPYCATDPANGGSTNFSLDPRRRVVVAAVIDCTEEEIKGKTVDVKAEYFIEVFITEPVKGDPTDKKKFDMYIELIGPPINIGYENVATGTFRNLVQLYR